MNPYLVDDGITLYQAPNESILPELDDNSVDIVVTSPPYNMGLSPGGNGRGMYAPRTGGKTGGRFRDGYEESHDDAMPQDEYDEWQRSVLAECWRVARFGVFYNHRPRVEHGTLRTPLSGNYGPELVLRQIIVWDRLTGIDVNLRNYVTRQEWILLFAKPDFRLANHAASGVGDVWRLGMETAVKDHPAPFPVSLPARCIETTGATSVLDPFAGSGSTLIAAKQAGIIGIGIEKSPTYCALAQRRLATTTRSLFAGNDPQHEQESLL